MKNYYVGLDLGTDSIGWAVTDENYNIPKFRGNAMWGIRLLDSGETAAEYRSFRSARRRLDRSKFRINCLEMLFNDEIAKTDVAFFQRIKESALYDGDKRVDGKYSLFNDENYTDKDYYKEYPTIYHLRQELVNNEKPHDVRLVYLAISHIIKNRGHFLFDSDNLGNNNNLEFSQLWNEFNNYICDNYECDGFYCDNLLEVESSLKDRSLTVTKKKDSLIKAFSLNKKSNKFEIAILSLLSGATVKSKDLFATDEFDNTPAKTICLKNGYDEKSAEYEEIFGEKFELIEKIKAIFDWSILADILNGKPYISFAKVDVFEKHKKDLKLLKEYVKSYVPEKYDLIFNENSDKVSNYLAYSGYSKKHPIEKKCSQELFCEFLRKQLPKEPAEEKYQQMYNELASDSFMPKAVTKDNSVIPMQVNREELKAILKNAQQYLPFLSVADEEGKTVSEKIIDIFNFRVPYYVGPLNKHSDKSWVVRANDKIYPWNFEKIVDIDKSAEKFIENLTSKCTYLPREDVIPKNSLLYSAFMVLNELNNLRIDGEKISVELKQSIYRDLFEKNNKVSFSRLKKYLDSNGYKDAEITGIDGDFKSNLKPFRDLGFIDLPYSDKEEIIKAITIFGDDKKLLKNRLLKMYGDTLSKDDIQRISKLKYTGWSRLSKKLLTGIYSVLYSTGEYTNIINALWETNDNLMQLLSSNYDFKANIEKENKTIEFTSLKQEIDNLYVSPKIKRPIYQAMQIVDEIVKIQGCEPKKIFIEVARCEGEKKRTVSRKQRLLDLYKYCKNEEKELYEQLLNTEENELRKDSLYLYYTQFGKCMYTGKSISIDEIYNSNIYDIDHIFPRSKIKDDSLDNRVLVLKTANEIKGNIYPISSDVRNKMAAFWKMLLSKELISKKKFDRLTGNMPLTDDDIMSFVSRQLVETRQSTKAVAQLLEKRYPDTNVEYIKAGLVSDFRRDFKMLKSRDVNDFHHAKDAYLNIVVGNVYTVKAKQAYFINNIQSGTWSMNRMFDYSTKGAWIAENGESLKTVKSTMAKNNIRFTRYSYKKHGKLFDATIQKKTGKASVPLKENSSLSNTDKYGGYTKITVSYFTIVKTLDGNKKSITIAPVYLYNEHKYIENPIDYISNVLNKKVVEVLLPCVKIDSLFSVNGFNINISGNGDSGRFVYKPAMQLVLDYKFEEYIKKLSDYSKKCQERKEVIPITKFDVFTVEDNLKLYDILCQKFTNTIFKVVFEDFGNKLKEKRSKFIELPLYEQCNTLILIIKYLHCNAYHEKLKYLEMNCPVYRMNKNLLTKGINSFKIINQSITGLFEQEIDLLN